MGIQCKEFLPTCRNTGTSCVHLAGDGCMYSFHSVVTICLDTRQMMHVNKLTFLMPHKWWIFYLTSFYAYNHIFYYSVTLLWTWFIWLRIDQWQTFVNMVMNARFKVLKVSCLIIQVFSIMMCVVGWVVSDVLEEHSAFIFSGQEAFILLTSEGGALSYFETLGNTQLHGVIWPRRPYFS
jgi:hypothetical protein